MADFTPIAGFEDLWRAIGGRRIYKFSSGAGDGRARLARMVRRAPEVVVSAVGASHSRRRLREHLSYISRKGELVLEGSDGERMKGRAALADIAEDWAWGAAVNSHDTRATPISRSMVLSAPSGSDRDAIEAGVRAFCAERLDGRWDFCLAHHRDTPNPHAHLVVRVLGHDGEMFHLSPSDLWLWREGFAEALQREGLDVQATPRRARGITLKAQSTAARYLREDYEAGRRIEPRFMKAAQEEASRLIRGDGADLKPWEEALLERRRIIRAAFSRVAAELERSATPSDRELAQGIAVYLREMPPPHTKRFLAAQQQQARLLRTSIQHDRETPNRASERDRDR